MSIMDTYREILNTEGEAMADAFMEAYEADMFRDTDDDPENDEPDPMEGSLDDGCPECGSLNILTRIVVIKCGDCGVYL